MMNRPFTNRLAACALAALAACGDPGTSPAPVLPLDLTGNWTMKSFDTRAVPANYAEFFDELVGDHVVAHVEIRLDSAIKAMRRDRTYERRYYFTELHDGVVAFRYLWGDHGKFSVSASPTYAIQLTSEYIQNLTASGSISAAGNIELTEPIWLGEDPRHTVWIKRP